MFNSFSLNSFNASLHIFHIIKYFSSLHFQVFELNTRLAETDNAVWIQVIFNLSDNTILTNKSKKRIQLYSYTPKGSALNIYIYIIHLASILCFRIIVINVSFMDTLSGCLIPLTFWQ